MQTGHIKSYLAALTLLWCVAMPAWAQTGVDNRPGIIMEIPAIPGEYATPYVMAGLQQLKAEMYKESLAILRVPLSRTAQTHMPIILVLWHWQKWLIESAVMPTSI
ncbi:MAG: hypothetical protein IPL73_03460 [Candidatus Obscuribacter sp.]|nr:hypothetical protein [Candidatus Obscuribacter sp.]